MKKRLVPKNHDYPFRCESGRNEEETGMESDTVESLQEIQSGGEQED